MRPFEVSASFSNLRILGERLQRGFSRTEKNKIVQQESESNESDSDIDLIAKKQANSNLPAKKTFVKSENHSLKPENVKKPEVKHIKKDAALNKRPVESSEDSEEEVVQKKPVKKTKQATAESSDDEDSDDQKMKQEKIKAQPQKVQPKKQVAKPVVESSDEEEEKPSRKGSDKIKNELVKKVSVRM